MVVLVMQLVMSEALPVTNGSGSIQGVAAHLDYRPDIDGLRAVAVIAVVVYHAFPSLLKGGFVGVDVFFVISGFLISSIILKDLSTGTFSFRKFYARRVRRIFPALALVLAATMLVGWLFLFPSEFKQLGRHVLGGAAFVSNLVLWRETGYFDAAADAKPLLHLWSLGIEEQFYLFFPVALVLLSRMGIRTVWPVVCVAVLSLVASVYLTGRSPSAAFYLPITRIWELMAGALLACLSESSSRGEFSGSWSAQSRNMASLAGAVLIALALLLVDSTKAFPGWWALLPVAGATLIIAAGHSTWLNSRILGSRPLVFVGLISYPLYLWHWPLLSFWSIVSNRSPSVTPKLALVACSFVLATATYYLLERPVRARRMRRAAVPLFSSAIAALALAGCAVDQTDSATRLGRTPELVPVLRALNDWHFPGDGAEIAGKQDLKVLFIGDSFLEQYYSRVERVLADAPNTYSVVYGGTGGCPPIPDVSRIADPGGCIKANDAAFSLARTPGVKRIVLGSAWHYFYPVSGSSKALPPLQFEHDAMVFAAGDAEVRGIRPGTGSFDAAFKRLELLVGEFVSAGKQVYIVLPSPISDEFDPRGMIDRFRARPVERQGVSRETYEQDFSPVLAELKQIGASTGAVLLDPTADLCSAGLCPAFDGDEPIYTDTGHIRTGYVREKMVFIDRVLLDE